MEESMEKSGLSKHKKKYLSKIYYDLNSSASYSGINKLLKKIRADQKYKINEEELKKWLSSQNTYTSFKPVTGKFKRPRIIANTIHGQYEIDCAYLNKYAAQNSGYKFFVLVIDVLSRFVWTAPLKSLKSEEVISALKKLIGNNPVKQIRTDHGSEFISKHAAQFFKSLGVKHFLSNNEVKCAIAERAIKTIKSKIIKYLHARKTKLWKDILADITKSYNNSVHRELGMSPAEALRSPEHELFIEQYFTKPLLQSLKKRENQNSSKYNFSFKVGDKVKLSILRSKFHREYSENYSNEVFLIASRWKSQNIPIYKIKSMSNELIEGTFYTKELQLIHLESNDLYIIEKVLKERVMNGKHQSLVKWQNYDNKFNSWVDSDTIQDV